jgi:hypothetical protein
MWEDVTGMRPLHAGFWVAGCAVGGKMLKIALEILFLALIVYLLVSVVKPERF